MKKDKNWIQKADLKEDAFSNKAKRANMSTMKFAQKVIREYKKKEKHTPAETKTYRQAIVARTFSQLRKKNK